MKRKLIVSLLFGLLIFSVSPQILAKGESYKKEKIIGTVIAYDQRAFLICLTVTSCPVTLIVRIDGRDKKRIAPRFIQVAYSFHESSGGFPNSLLEGRRQWRFGLTRDFSCAVLVREKVIMKDEKIGKGTDSSIPIWRLVAGAENEKIPYGETLICYRLKAGYYKPYKK